jgi:hypothetical protein
VRDPDEGMAADGTIVTGVRRDRVPAAFEPVLAAAVAAVPDGVGLYVYGSVATGQARVGRSDVDLISLGLPDDDARRLGAALAERFPALCRGVEIGPVQPEHLAGNSDEAYGNRVFLRHYAVWVAGPSRPPESPYPADVRAARGFNGDIGAHARRWAAAPDAGLARRVARKTLMAAASLVSVHDRTWTTDRHGAALRWAEIDPPAADGLAVLDRWTDDAAGATPDDVRAAVEGVVARVVTAFEETIGLWSDPPARVARS